MYIFNGAQVIAEYDNGAAVGSPTREYIYLGDRKLAVYFGSTITYYHADHLSTRRTTNSSGSGTTNLGNFPFGEAWYGTGAKWRFTSYERDTETGNDYAVMRSYVNRLGRFSSPDPVGGNVFNPQRLNRYAYVGGDPANLIDPQGLDWGDPDDDGVINRPPMLPMESDAVLNTLGSNNCVYCQMPLWMILGNSVAWRLSFMGATQSEAEYMANGMVDYLFYGGPSSNTVYTSVYAALAAASLADAAATKAKADGIDREYWSKVYAHDGFYTISAALPGDPCTHMPDNQWICRSGVPYELPLNIVGLTHSHLDDNPLEGEDLLTLTSYGHPVWGGLAPLGIPGQVQIFNPFTLDVCVLLGPTNWITPNRCR